MIRIDKEEDRPLDESLGSKKKNTALLVSKRTSAGWVERQARTPAVANVGCGKERRLPSLSDLKCRLPIH